MRKRENGRTRPFCRVRRHRNPNIRGVNGVFVDRARPWILAGGRYGGLLKALRQCKVRYPLTAQHVHNTLLQRHNLFVAQRPANERACELAGEIRHLWHCRLAFAHNQREHAVRQLLAHQTDNCAPTAKNGSWGVGFRNRREVVKKCLQDLGFSTEWLYHGVKREVFVVPLAQNTRDFLQGNHQRLRWYGNSVADLHNWFKQRWLLPRAGRDQTYRDFRPEQYRIWDSPRSIATDPTPILD